MPVIGDCCLRQPSTTVIPSRQPPSFVNPRHKPTVQNNLRNFFTFTTDSCSRSDPPSYAPLRQMAEHEQPAHNRKDHHCHVHTPLNPDARDCRPPVRRQGSDPARQYTPGRPPVVLVRKNKETTVRSQVVWKLTNAREVHKRNPHLSLTVGPSALRDRAGQAGTTLKIRD